MNKRSISIPAKDKLEKALHEVRKKTLGLRAAARTYGIPKSTIYDRITGRVSEGPAKLGHGSYLTADEETKITNWLIDMCKCGFPLNRKNLLDIVQKIIIDSKRNTPFKNGRPGRTWLKLFFKRNECLVEKEAEAISNGRAAVTEEFIRRWFQELEEYVLTNDLGEILSDPSRMFNGDESGFSMCPKTGKIIAPRGYKNALEIKMGSEKENVTVLVVVSSNGEILPPMVIFPYLRPPKDLVNSMPENWILGRSESGWMRSETFFEYVANGFNNYLNELNERSIKRPVILFVDGHKSHLTMELSEFCNKNQIVLYALPPNTTHIMQPSDVSVFKPLKSNWKENVRQWQMEHLGEVFTKKHFCPMLEKTLKTCNGLSQSIQNGFRKSGLFPFNPNAVDFTKCVSNNMNNLSESNVCVENQLQPEKFKTAAEVILNLELQFRERGLDPIAILDDIDSSKQNVCSDIDNQHNNERTTETISELCSPATEPIFLDIDVPASVYTVTNDGILELCEENAHGKSPSAAVRSDTPRSVNVSFVTESSAMAEEGATPTSSVNINSLSQAISSNEVPVADSSLNASSDLEAHLFYPKKLECKGKRKSSSRLPSAISYKEWREIYYEKERQKSDKLEAAAKRREERIANKDKKKQKRVKVPKKSS